MWARATVDDITHNPSYLSVWLLGRIDPYYPIPCPVTDWFPHTIPCVDFIEEQHRPCVQAYMDALQYGTPRPLTTTLILQNILFLFIEGYLISCVVGLLLAAARMRPRYREMASL